MRAVSVLGVLNWMVCLALLLVVVGQNRMLNLLIQKEKDLKIEAQRLQNQHENVNTEKETLDKKLNLEIKEVEDLQDEVSTLGLELQKEKRDTETCQKEQKKLMDDFNRVQNQLNEAEASTKKESEAWNQEINILKEQQKEFRPICNYVKNSTHALKMCGPKPGAPHQ